MINRTTVDSLLDDETKTELSLYPGVLTKGRKRDKVLTYLQARIDQTDDKDWKMLWNILHIMIEANGVIGAERSKQTASHICQVLMANSNTVDDLPPNELDNPNPSSYTSDLISIQELLLSGKVFLLLMYEI